MCEIHTIFYQLIAVTTINFRQKQVQQLAEIFILKLCMKHKCMVLNLVLPGNCLRCGYEPVKYSMHIQVVTMLRCDIGRYQLLSAMPMYCCGNHKVNVLGVLFCLGTSLCHVVITVLMQGLHLLALCNVSLLVYLVLVLTLCVCLWQIAI